MVRTADFQSANTGSIPVGSAKNALVVYLAMTTDFQSVEVGSIPIESTKMSP